MVEYLQLSYGDVLKAVILIHSYYVLVDASFIL